MDERPPESSAGPAPDEGLGARMARALGGPPGWMVNAPFTRAVVWANVAVYVAELFFSKSAGAVAATPAGVMLAMGANYAAATVAEHRYETLVTSCFLHFSILHIGFNLYALRQIGPPIERSVGTARIAPMYLVSGAAGSLVSTLVGWLTGEERLSAGASGAICGIIGAALVLGLRAEGRKSRLAWAMGRWLAMLLVIQFVANLANVPASFDNAAHFGGAIVGGLFAAAWRKGPPPTERAKRRALAVAALGVTAAFALTAYRDHQDPFATLRVGERFRRASAALAAGSCPEALEAIAATRRLAPGAPDVLALQQEYDATCR